MCHPFTNRSKVSDDAFYRIHGAKVAANLAAALAFLTAFSYTRNHISKLDVQVFTTKRMLLFSVLDLILTLIAMITTGLLRLATAAARMIGHRLRDAAWLT